MYHNSKRTFWEYKVTARAGFVCVCLTHTSSWCAYSCAVQVVSFVRVSSRRVVTFGAVTSSV
jgi:hypothetical protein